MSVHQLANDMEMCLISYVTQACPANTGCEGDAAKAIIVHSNPVYADPLDSASPGDQDQDHADGGVVSMARDGYGFYELLCAP